MLRSRNWIRNLKRSLLRESLERDANAPRRDARRPRFEPLEDRRVMAVAVEAFTPTASGFTAQLTEEIRVENLNLYDTQGGAMGAADVTLRGESVGDVTGSLVVRGTELTFVATGGVLAPDTYVATLRSASDAIVDAALGELLDGDGDGTDLRREAVRAERRRYHERFRALVEEGQREGSFRAPPPADIAVHFFFGTVHQLGTWYRPGGRLETAAISEHYVDLFLNGLRS